jgi:hypothetical protein
VVQEQQLGDGQRLAALGAAEAAQRVGQLAAVRGEL